MVDFSKRLKFGKYNYLNTEDLILRADEFLMNEDKPRYNLVAFDTETNGLSHKKNVVIGFSFSVNDWQGFYVPILEWVPYEESLKSRKVNKEDVDSYMEGRFVGVWDGKEYPEFVTPQEIEMPEFLAGMLERWFTHKDVKLLMHNAPFDCNMVHSSFGVELTQNLHCDTVLLHHFLDENAKHGLKLIAEQWKEALGFDPYKDAAMEQKELGESIIRNGGTFNTRTKTVWRASAEFMGKYACADTFLTFGVYNEGMKQMEAQYEARHFELFYDIEIMPLCREVVIPMQRKGVQIDLSHFKKLLEETVSKMDTLEDEIHELLGDKLNGFTMGKSIEEEISHQALLKKIIELEGLAIPKKHDKKTDTWKESLAKAVVKKEYEANPHWVWGYIIGEDELKYSDKRLKKLRNDMYFEKTGRRHHFNIGAVYHLRWLFIDKLGHDPTALPQTKSATPDNPIPEMGADVLKDHFLKDYEFVKPLLLWKKLSKLVGTYIKPAIDLEIEERLYMNMNQAGTTSGRFACSGGYNLQTLPKVEEIDKCYSCGSKNVDVEHPIELLANMTCKDCGHVEEDILCSSAIKAGFIAPKGMKIVNADYSSLEPRCFAFVSGDKKLKEIYWDNLDMYSKVYCDTLDDKGQYSADPEAENFLKKLNKKGRDMVKPVILGITYGARGPQVANLMQFKTTKTDKDTGEEVEVTDFERGKLYRETFLQTYPELKDYMYRMELQALSQGWVENLIGRRRKFLVAPIVYKLLLEKGIDYETFLDTGRKRLEKTTVEVQNRELDSEDLRNLFRDLGFKPREIDEAKTKGNFNWAYIKAKFKNDLDNAKNFPIQSLAAHICNMGMLDTTRLFKEAGMEDAYIFLQVHDEISEYVPEEEVDAGVAMLQFGMEENQFAKLLDIKMIAEPLVASTLKEAK